MHTDRFIMDTDYRKQLVHEYSLINTTEYPSIQIVISYCRSPSEFYCQILKFAKYLHILEKPLIRILPSDIKIGSLILYYSKKLEKYVRGLVSSIDNLNYNAFAIDYGFIEDDIEKDNIFKPTIAFPPIAIQCELANSQPVLNATAQATAYFKEFSNQELSLRIKAKINNKYLVELQRRDMTEDIATYLLFLGVAALPCQNNSISRSKLPKIIMKYTSPYKTLNVGQKILVRSLAVNLSYERSIDSFYVATVEDYADYIKNRKSRTNKNKFLEEPRMKPGMLVTVEINKIIEKAVILTYSNKINVGVELLDLGGEIQVPVNEVKIMPTELIKTEGIAIYCSADNASDFRDSTNQFLQPGSEFFITVLKTGTKFHKPNIVAIEPLTE